MKHNKKVNPLKHFNDLKAAAVKKGNGQLANYKKSLKRFQGDVTGSQVVTPPANTPRPRLSDMSAFAVDQNQDMNVGDKGVMNREAMAGSFNSNPKRKPKQIMAGSMDGYQKKGGSVKKNKKC